MNLKSENIQGLENLDFEKGNGLIPAIVQDAGNGEVLMLAYVSPESLQKTLDTGLATYYSRSRSSLWTKGETSGHFQKIRKILYDCDGDTLLFIVEQTGAACHTGHRSCFYRSLEPIHKETEDGHEESGKEIE